MLTDPLSCRVYSLPAGTPSPAQGVALLHELHAASEEAASPFTDKGGGVLCIMQTQPQRGWWIARLLGHVSLILVTSEGAIKTAGLSGKLRDPPAGCYADAMLVNRNCSYHSGLKMKVHHCARLATPAQWRVATTKFAETLRVDFQRTYSLLRWNCVSWAVEAWNAIGLSKVACAVPIPALIRPLQPTDP